MWWGGGGRGNGEWRGAGGCAQAVCRRDPFAWLGDVCTELTGLPTRGHSPAFAFPPCLFLHTRPSMISVPLHSVTQIPKGGWERGAEGKSRFTWQSVMGGRGGHCQMGTETWNQRTSGLRVERIAMSQTIQTVSSITRSHPHTHTHTPTHTHTRHVTYL